MHFSPYSILPLTAGLLTFALGVTALIKGHQSELNRIFSGMCLAFTGWLVGYATAYSLTNSQAALIACKTASSFVNFTPVFAYHLSLLLVRRKTLELKLISLTYIITIGLTIIIATTDLLIDGAQKFFFGYYGKAGPFYWLNISFFLIIIGRFLYITFDALKDQTITAQQRQQIKFFLFALAITSIASVDFFPKYGIKIYPFGALFELIGMSILAYAVVKRQFLNITIVIKTSLVYSALVGTITAFYLLLVIGAEKLFQGLVGYKSLLLNLAAIFIIAILFNPLRDWIQRFLDRKFFNASPAQLAEENVKLRQEVTQADRMKAVATLASGMAHEIRNPLTAIQTFSEYLPKKLDDKEFLLKFSKLVGKEVTRINDLITQLLDFAKPMPPKMTTVDINSLLREILDFLNSRLVPRNIILKEKLLASPSMIQADPNQLKQALLNVLINAIEAMPGGGNLTVSTAVYGLKCTVYSQESKNTAKSSPDTVNIKPYTVNPPAGHAGEIPHTVNGKPNTAISPTLVVEIADTGHGIAPADLPHIFDPFYSKKDHGTGLGLAITKGIVEQHGGKVTVKSIPGQGATVRITFPALIPQE